MNTPRILIAGIGNIFLGDDGFGVEVVQRLAARSLPGGVQVADFGIRGFDLAYALLNGYDVTILVDAIPRGEAPGTVCVLEPDLGHPGSQEDEAAIETHGMNPMRVLNMVKSMGGQLKRILVVGCEPLTLGPEEGAMGLSAPVDAAVNEAASMIESLVARILEEAYPVRTV
jgi:hydrogenase maturation protease